MSSVFLLLFSQHNQENKLLVINHPVTLVIKIEQESKDRKITALSDTFIFLAELALIGHLTSVSYSHRLITFNANI